MRFASWTSVLSLGLCAFGASVTLWRRPTVFPPSHPLFWATTATVVALWLVTVVSFAAALRAWPRLSFAMGLVPGVLLMSGSVAGRFVFPMTEGTYFGAPFSVGLLWVVTAYRAFRELGARQRLAVVAASMVWVPLGAVQSMARAPPEVGTAPLLAELPASGARELEGVTVTGDGHVQVACGRGVMTIGTLLRFQDASDDGFWPITRTPTVLRAMEPPALDGPLRRASLSLERIDGGVLIGAATLVPKKTASHLSRYSDVTVTGLTAPSLRFDVTGAVELPLLPFDYPKGRPAHFAALTPEGELVAWRGTSAEKGPFVELARGKVARGAPVTMTLLEEGRPQCSVTWEDFTAQADVTLSPAAGEGVPVNVIQFGRPATDESRVVVIVSLASTGVGQGMETVWHAQGVYRNRVVVSAP